MHTQRSLDEFRNEPFTDYSQPENQIAMQAALEGVRAELGREYPITINGEKITLENKFQSINPANKTEVVGVFSEGDTDAENLVNRAIEAATNAFKLWKNVSAAERAEYLFKAAEIIRQRKHYFRLGWFSRSARPGPRPTAIRPRRSIFANFTAGKCCAGAASSL